MSLNKSSIVTYLYIIIIPTILFIFNGIMIIFPKEIISGAEKGLLLWWNKVVPSLLPFMIGSNMLIKLNFPKIIGVTLKIPMEKIFRLRGICAFPIISGMLSGYPMGAKTTGELYQNGSITKAEAERMLLFVNTSGPLFMLGTVGINMLGGKSYGYGIMVAHYGAALIIMLLSSLGAEKIKCTDNFTTLLKHKEKIPLGKAMGEGVYSAMDTIVMIGGYITLFSVLGAVMEKTGLTTLLSRFLLWLPLSPKEAKAIIMGIFEITTGCGLLTEKVGSLTAALCCGIISWGGFSIHAQTLNILDKCSLDGKKYLLGKLLHGITAFVIGYIIFCR